LWDLILITKEPLLELKILVIHFSKYLVGGQRNERKKWVHPLETVDAIIFVVALSQFNELCYEDENTNKMIESLELAKLLSTENNLPDVPMFLFLTKQDVFIEELKKDMISMAFPNCPKDLTRLQTSSIFFSPREVKESPFSKSISYYSLKPKTSLSMSVINENGNSIKIVELGEDEICQIFSFLNYKEILKFSQVNSTFLNASINDSLWRSICLNYDKTLDFETVESFYDQTSIHSPWKHYFVESKSVYVKNQNYIIQQFQEATNYRFTGVYVANALDQSINHVLDEIFDEICSLTQE
jgi:hypothetical protein